MSSGLEITIYLAAALVAGIAAAAISRAKHRYSGFWTALCFLFPPALVLLLVLPKARAPMAVAGGGGRDPDNLDDF